MIAIVEAGARSEVGVWKCGVLAPFIHGMAECGATSGSIPDPQRLGVAGSIARYRGTDFGSVIPTAAEGGHVRCRQCIGGHGLGRHYPMMQVRVCSGVGQDRRSQCKLWLEQRRPQCPRWYGTTLAKVLRGPTKSRCRRLCERSATPPSSAPRPCAT